MHVGYYVGADAFTFARECAAIHSAAFLPTGTRGWTTNEFESLFERDSTFLLRTSHGFLVADLIVDEVEILSIAVVPEHQGQKIGRALMTKLDSICTCRNVNKCLLEVASDNIAAISLYNMFGFRQFSIREGYFKRDNQYVSALMMTKTY